MLASVATHSSRSKIAPAALLELKNACDLFEAASPYGGRAGKFLVRVSVYLKKMMPMPVFSKIQPILKRLQMKAQKAYRDTNNGVVNIPNDIFKPSQPDEAKDELSIFSGKTHTVSTKVGSGATLHSSASTSNSIPTSRTSSKGSRSASDSPQQMFTDNPSFAGVHPSLVLELNVFHGQIKEQIQNAYRTGGEVFGAGPMVVDPVPRAPVRPKASAQQLQHQAQQQVQRQQQAQLLEQQHQQALYQQAKHKQEQLEQQEMERLEREREEAERMEAERLEFERQELARKQHLQQLELQRQQNQQQELRRQQEAQEQQHRQLDIQQRRRQEQYRQQLEIQQQQQQMAQRHQPMYETGPQQAMYTTAAPAMPAPPTHTPQVPPGSSRHQRHPSNPQTQHGIQQQQIYQHPQPQHYRYMPCHEAPVPQPSVLHTNPPPAVVAPQHHTHMSQHSITPQHTGGMTADPQHHPRAPQHPTYATATSPSKNTPPEYSYHPSPESMHSGASSGDYTPPTTSYGGSQSRPSVSVPPTPAAASTSYIPETYRYWPAASTSFAMPDQQATGPPVAYAPPHGYQQQHQPQGYHPQQHEHQYQHQHYTPEGALRGIAADDSSLQETWQSYMNNVGSVNLDLQS